MAECLASGDDPRTPCFPWRSPLPVAVVSKSRCRLQVDLFDKHRIERSNVRLINIAVLERWRFVRSNDTDIIDIRNCRTENDTCRDWIRTKGYGYLKGNSRKSSFVEDAWQKDSFIERLKIVVEAIFNNLRSISMLGFTSHAPAAFTSVGWCYKTSASISFFVTTNVSVLAAAVTAQLRSKIRSRKTY